MAALCCCCALVLLAEGASAAAAATGKVPDGCVRASRGDVAPIGGDFTPDRGTWTVYVKAGTTAWADGTFCPAPPPGAAAPAAAGSSGGGLTLEQAAQIAWPSDSP